MTLHHSSRRRTTNVHNRSKDFTLCIFNEDYIRIGKLVSKIPYAETGGNLFGLWTNQGNPVVLVATGPGKNCKRSSASFYQDIPYMQRVGNLLTGNYPLCHIGEWHSHHQMQLYQPSFGDCNTVQRNYPTGSQGFVLMIANILQNGTVKLSPYKFIDESSPYTKGGIEVITVENPFMDVRQITSEIKYGEEERISQQSCQETLTEKYPCLPAEKQIVEDMNPKRNHHPSPPSNRRSGTPSKKVKRSSSPEGQKDHSWQKPTEQDVQRAVHTHPHPPLHSKINSKPSPKRASRISGAIVQSSQSTMPFRQEKLQETTHSQRSFAQAGRSPTASYSTANPQERTQVQTQLWYETRPDVLRTTYDFITSLADDQKTVNISSDKITLNMEFTHHHHEWSIDFPSDFPRGSVKLKKSGLYTDSYSIEGLGDIDSFKTKLKSTLQKECTKCGLYMHQSSPARNSIANRQERSQLVQTDEDISRNRHTTQWHEIQPDTLRTTLDFVGSLADDQKTVNISRDKKTLDITIKFTHHNYEWSIKFPSDFPWGSAKLKERFYDDTYPVLGQGDIANFKAKLQSILRDQCTKCQIYSTRHDRRKIYY